MKRFLFGWGLGVKVMQVLVLILVMLFSWMSPGAVVEVQAHHENGVLVTALLAASPGESAKDLYGFTGDILKDACTHNREWDAALWSRIGKQQAAYKAARAEEDWKAAAILTPMKWVEAWMYVRLGKDLIDTVNPVDGIDRDEKATLAEASEWYARARETALDASLCRTNSLTHDEVEAQVKDCLAKVSSGELYIDRCAGAKPWPIPTPTSVSSSGKGMASEYYVRYLE